MDANAGVAVVSPHVDSEVGRLRQVMLHRPDPASQRSCPLVRDAA